MGSFLVRLADAAYFQEDYESAIRWARKALVQPQFQWSRYAVLLASLGQLGRTDEAERVLAELLEQRPDFSLEFVRATHLISGERDFDVYLDGLAKAGVAERRPRTRP
jgi:pentatricopeptide repeat protein